MWIDVEQNTEEWHQLRVGRIGGSSLGCVMAHHDKPLQNGSPRWGDPAKRLALKKALEQITGVGVNGGELKSPHLDRGHAEEPIARELYEEKKLCEVKNGGYYTYSDDIGVSPDGRVGEKGLIEIKSVIYPVHAATLKKNTYDSKYKWQLFMELLVGGAEDGREWIDYVSYCSEYPPPANLFIKRLHKKDFTEEFTAINNRLKEFRVLVDSEKAFIKRTVG